MARAPLGPPVDPEQVFPIFREKKPCKCCEAPLVPCCGEAYFNELTTKTIHCVVSNLGNCNCLDGLTYDLTYNSSLGYWQQLPWKLVDCSSGSCPGLVRFAVVITCTTTCDLTNALYYPHAGWCPNTSQNDPLCQFFSPFGTPDCGTYLFSCGGGTANFDMYIELASLSVPNCCSTGGLGRIAIHATA